MLSFENTKIEHKIEIGYLNDKIDSLEKENAAFKMSYKIRCFDEYLSKQRIFNVIYVGFNLLLCLFSHLLAIPG